MAAENNPASQAARVGAEETSMSDKVYGVPAEWTKRAFVNEAQYREMYARSLADPNGFWPSRPSASIG